MLFSKPWKVKNMSNKSNSFLNPLQPIAGFVKKAELGGAGNDVQFEQAFSNLAHAYLKDKAPGLLDYEVGFELMERNEDNTKAVGLFGFKVGPQWLYAPVFFINGDLKGHELLYLKDQDQFVPLKENWLNYILRRKPASLGKKTDQNMSRLGFLSPDLQAFSRPPAKFASAITKTAGLPSSPFGTPTPDEAYAAEKAKKKAMQPPVVRPPIPPLPKFNPPDQFLEEMRRERVILPDGSLDPVRAKALQEARKAANPAGAGAAAGATMGGMHPMSPNPSAPLPSIPGSSGGVLPSNDSLPRRAVTPQAGPSVADYIEQNGGELSPNQQGMAQNLKKVMEGIKAKEQQKQTIANNNFPPAPKAKKKSKTPAAKPAPTPPAKPAEPEEPKLTTPAYKQASSDRQEMMEGVRAFAKFACTNPSNDPKFANQLTLKSFLTKEAAHGKQAFKELVKALIGTCQQFPKMAEAIEKVYGPDFIKNAVDKLKSLPEPGILSEEDVYIKPQEKQALTIMIRSFNASSDGVMDSPKADKEKLLTDGVIFRDARTKDDAAIAYKVQEPTSIENPASTGVYDLLVCPFSMLKTIIFLMPHGPSGRQDFATVVNYEGEKHWINSHPGNLFTRPPRDGGQDAPESKNSGQSFAKFFEGLSSISSLSKGNVYLVVSESGDASVPFEVLSVSGDSDGTSGYKVRYLDYASQARPKYLPAVAKGAYNDFSGGMARIGGGKSLYVTDKPGVRIKAINGDLYVPGNFKALKLSGDSCCGDGAIVPGDLNDLQHAIYQKTASLNVRHTGSEVSINGRVLDPQNALIHLVRDVSLREKQARAILDEAKALKVANYIIHKPVKEDAEDLIKSAAPGDPMDPSMMGGTSAPAFPTQPTGMEQTLLGSVQSSYPSQQAIPAMTGTSLQSNTAAYDPRLPDPKTMAIGYNASQSGQKEVFDTSMIGTLIKSVRDDTMVDRHLGDLMGGLDKIGRILFSFYWHKDKFEDRYGKKDMPELEDNLRNSFEQMGDLLLFLKQKTIDSYPDEGISLDDNNV